MIAESLQLQADMTPAGWSNRMHEALTCEISLFPASGPPVLPAVCAAAVGHCVIRHSLEVMCNGKDFQPN